MRGRRVKSPNPKVTTELNYNYTISCYDGRGRSVSFRDITGGDLEYFDQVLNRGENNLIGSDYVVDILSKLCTSPIHANFRQLPPRIVRVLYEEVSSNILKNYIPKENWLRQCYSIQNGSFGNLAAMEQVPLSKFTAMCLIHQEAIDQIKNPATGLESVPSEV